MTTQHQPVDVSIILISYNTRELTLRCIAQLGKVCGKLNYEVIVVDNASVDGSAQAIAEAFPQVNVVRSDLNLGFANAVNLAATHATGRYLQLLNPDTEPDTAFVAELMEFAEKHPERRVYSGWTKGSDGRSDEKTGFGIPSLWSYFCFATGLSTVASGSRLFNPEALPGFDRSAGGVVPAVSGCVLFIERELFNELGGFAPEYFMYSEDIDLCYRAAKLNAQPTVVATASIIHVGGASSSSARKLDMLLRGKVTFMKLHWTPRQEALGRFYLKCGVLLRGSVRKGPWRSAWQGRSGWITGWTPEPRG